MDYLPLASLSPLAKQDDGIGCSYTSYYVPDLGLYVVLRKNESNTYHYFTSYNEIEYKDAWENYKDLTYTSQAPTGVDFSAIVLRDALQDTVDSNQALSDAITANQQSQLANSILIRQENEKQTSILRMIATDGAMGDNGGVPASTGTESDPYHVTGTVAITGRVATEVINFPQTQEVSIAELPPIQGTVSINNFPATPTSIEVSNLPAVQHVVVDNPTTQQPVTGEVAITNLPAIQEVKGSVTISNQPVSYPVTGKFWQDVQAVSGPLTNVELRAAPVPVTFAFPNTQQVSGTVAISNYPSLQRVTVDNPTTSVSITNHPTTYPVTGKFWQDVQPVSGPLTDSQLRASALPILVTNPTVTVANPVTTVAVSALPSGYGTSTNQLIANVSLNSIDTKLTPVSTSALQTAGNTSLASIDSKLTSPLNVRISPSSTGGIPSKLIVASSVGTSATVVKNAPGQVYGLVMSNTSGSVVYLNMYNKATAPIASDTPIQLYPIPPGQTIQLSFPLGSTYSTGIALTLTSNIALLGILTGLLTANQVVLNIEYA